MATSEKDDRSESENTRDGDEARTGEAAPPVQTPADELSSGVATEADVGRRDGDVTADPSDKGSAFAKPGKTAGGTRQPRTPAKRVVAAKGARRAAGAASTPARAKGGSLAKSVLLFVVIVGGLAAGFALLGREDGGGGKSMPNWKTGQVVDVEITLVKTDINDLTCAAGDEVAGRHCANEAQTRRWSKGDNNDDKKLLRPYTTTNGWEMLAAGLWSEPAMAQASLPNTRFTVKCKFNVEGKVRKPAIRWANDRPWYDSPGDWHAGVVSGCSLIP